MNTTKPYKGIERFLKENEYTHTVEYVLSEYKDRYGRWYVSHTTKHTIMNCIKHLKELVEMGY